MIVNKEMFDRNTVGQPDISNRRLVWIPFKGLYWEPIDSTPSPSAEEKSIPDQSKSQLPSIQNQPPLPNWQISWSPPDWLKTLLKTFSPSSPDVKEPVKEADAGESPGPASADEAISAAGPSISALTKQEALQHVIKLYKEAVGGDKKAAEDAIKVLEELRKKDPEDILVKAFYGGTIALLARDTVDRLAKGLQERYTLNKSAAEDPDLWVHRLKTFLSARIPGDFFHRTHIAIEYFKYLVSLFQERPELLKTEVYWDILYHLGRAYYDMDLTQGANAIWNKLWNETTDSMYRKLLERDGFQPAGEPVDIDSWLKPARSPIQLWSKPVLDSSAPPAVTTGDGPAEEPEGPSPVSRSEAEPPIETASPAGEPEALPETAADTETISAAAPGQQMAFAFTEPAVDSSDSASQELMELESFKPAIEAVLKVTGHERAAEPVPYPDFDLNQARERIASISEAQPLLQEGIRLLHRGLAGNRLAVQAAYEALGRAHEIAPEDLDTMAYYASSAFLLCLDITDAGQMLDCAIKGVTLLNKLVNRSGGNPHYRMLRAFLFKALPESYFHLTETAIDDFDAVIAAYEQDHRLFPSEVYCQMLKELGAACRKVGQEEKARKAWEALNTHCSDPASLSQ
ncbi:MAG: hypothetical protein HPY50_12665 [Firmicutes bacterium]|nr:hypothetical protein [Bacillota bacterium]